MLLVLYLHIEIEFFGEREREGATVPQPPA